MGIRDQLIEIGYGTKTINRCVYAITNNDRLKFQTGFVQYDKNEVPVWRPFDPNDQSLDALWRKGTWQNIYILHMTKKENTQYVEYETADINFEGILVSLPQVSNSLMYSFKMYLKKQL